MSDAPVTQETVEKVLAELPDPETGRSLARMEQIRHITIDGRGVEVTLGLTSWSSLLWEQTRQEAERLLSEKLPTGTKVRVRIVEYVRPPEPIGEIGLTAKSVIAVGSGKGGVGKSTIAASLAYGLKNAGSAVGLMDADVYGPSIPHLLGVDERPHLENGRLQPIMKDGLRVMSMGFLVPPGEAVVWRGPMLHGAITQFLRDTEWGDLDYLIIDMPPGTGRHRAHALANVAAHRGGRRLHAAGRGAARCREGDRHVPQGQHSDAGHGREHELLPLPRLRQAVRHLRLRRGRAAGGGARRAVPGRSADQHRHPPTWRRRRDGRQFHRRIHGRFLRDICYRLVQQISTKHKAAPPMPALNILS